MRIRYWLRDLAGLAVILAAGLLAGLLAAAAASPAGPVPHPVTCHQVQQRHCHGR